MSLSLYKKKRDFKQTPEPTGGKTKSAGLLFVIQKHAASSLHYDLRLEMEGVLKSWAVPKGPSIDPATKRLAMMVEDHPYDYKDFEGTIAEGNYGAGTVIVWDNGTYEPLEEIEGKKAQEKHFLKQLEEGSIKFRLHGKKLQGEFALVRTRLAKNAWLLIKHRDEYAGETDITKQNESVISGKILEDTNKNGRTRKSSPAGDTPAKTVKKKSEAKPPRALKN